MPDLRDHLNQNRGFEACQPNLQEKLSNQRNQAHPNVGNCGIPEWTPERAYKQAREAQLVIYHMQEIINQPEEAFRILREERERDNATDSDDELELFAPHI